jgi:hypothetical protein
MAWVSETRGTFRPSLGFPGLLPPGFSREKPGGALLSVLPLTRRKAVCQVYADFGRIMNAHGSSADRSLNASPN